MIDPADPRVIAFVAAYWDWKMRKRTSEPTGPEFNLHPDVAEIVATQCHHEFEKMVLQKTLSR